MAKRLGCRPFVNLAIVNTEKIDTLREKQFKVTSNKGTITSVIGKGGGHIGFIEMAASICPNIAKMAEMAL